MNVVSASVHPRNVRKHALSAIALALVAHAGHAQKPKESIFNEKFLTINGDQANADLSMFSFGNQVMPGVYMVEIIRNGAPLSKVEVRFDAVEGKRDAVPCLTVDLLRSSGVNVEVFSSLSTLPPQSCVDLSAAVPEATATYDAGQQRLLLSIPQAALKRSARGAVEPSKWDHGISAAMLDYQLSVSRNHGSNSLSYRGPTSTGAFGGEKVERNTFYASVLGGFNLGDWRFRHRSNYDRGFDAKGRWQAVQTYAQRDLPSIGGQLLIGDGFTSAELFDGFQFRGVQVASDTAMLPDSLQGYAPTIRGVAQTNARVTVRQNGYIIYNTYVAPGPFALDDLYPTSSGGDLEVTITEADGRETRYIQAFAAVPTLLREGTWRYSATAGQFRSGDERYRGNAERPYFVQGTLARGLPKDFSVYGGATLSRGYQAGMIGTGKNMYGFGAVSLDLTHARTEGQGDQTLSGQSLRALYSKTIDDTGTTFRMAGYRYSTSGFRTFSESVEMRYAAENQLPFFNRRSEVRLDLAQPLGEWGSFYASARQQSYWGSDRKDKLVQVGYSGSYGRVGYNIFYSQVSNLRGPANRQVMLTLSIPLGSNVNASYAVSRNNQGRVTHQAGVSGSAWDDYRLTYGLTVDRSNEDGSNGSANLTYKGRSGQVNLSHSQGQGYGQTNISVAGGLVAHGEGVTLSQPLGETIALVRVPKASGVGIESQSGVSTDGSGHAVVPNLTPYRNNRLALLTQDLDDKVEVKHAAREVVPTRGAVVLAPYETSVGYRLMLTLTNPQGRPLPFGARIDNEAGQEVGVVGPEGQAYVTGAGETGTLKVIWGDRAGAQCQVSYRVPAQDVAAPIHEMKEICR